MVPITGQMSFPSALVNGSGPGNESLYKSFEAAFVGVSADDGAFSFAQPNSIMHAQAAIKSFIPLSITDEGRLSALSQRGEAQQACCQRSDCPRLGNNDARG